MNKMCFLMLGLAGMCAVAVLAPNAPLREFNASAMMLCVMIACWCYKEKS